MKTLVRLPKTSRPPPPTEYCLIASLISIVILVAVNGIGTTLNTAYTTVSTALK